VSKSSAEAEHFEHMLWCDAAAAAACRIFEEHPVQNFAVGDSIMTFDTMHT
jgi:hypothetical protein